MSFFFLHDPQLAAVLSVTAAPMGFRAELKHVESIHIATMSNVELLRRAAERTKYRFEVAAAAANHPPSHSQDPPPAGLNAPAHYMGGDYLIDGFIGSPPQPFSAIADTGSSLIWLQTQPCFTCFNQSTPYYNFSKSSSFSPLRCPSSLCDYLSPFSFCLSQCSYVNSYGDNSFTTGFLATENFTFGSGSVDGLVFGCGLLNVFDKATEGAGIIGLSGSGPLSLVSQMGYTVFSYCLASFANPNATTTLIFGPQANITAGVGNATVYAPLVQKNPFYYVDLKGISVGNTRLEIPDETFERKSNGSGGFIVDSGTTFTTLIDVAFDAVALEFEKQIELQLETNSSIQSETGLDLCFSTPPDTPSLAVPNLIFHFAGDADLVVAGENYVVLEDSQLCLTIVRSSGISILGNFQQKNTMVVYDLEQNFISFTPTQCGNL